MSLVGYRLWGHKELDMAEATKEKAMAPHSSKDFSDYGDIKPMWFLDANV